MGMTTLRKELDIGESMSFDGGRVVITLESKSGRRARFKVQVDAGLSIDKPRMSAHGIFAQKSVANTKSVH